MSLVLTTIVVTKRWAPDLRTVCRIIGGPLGDNMFIMPMSATGANPLTHYTSSGVMQDDKAALFGDADAMWAAVQASGNPVGSITLSKCQAIVAETTYTVGPEPVQLYTTMGLKRIPDPSQSYAELWENWRGVDDPETMPVDFTFYSIPF
jgi:hypothetical protein